VAQGAAVSGAEGALVGAILAALAEDEGVRAVLGDPVRIADSDGERPAYPYLEVARVSSEAAGSAGVEASVLRVDLAAVSRNDGGAGGIAAMAAMRVALETAELAMSGWRCVLLAPVFTDQLRQGRGVWRSILRLRAVVEAEA
jgi:hypothetical protein